MPALESVGDYIKESRRLLQDEIEPFRYGDVDIVEALNIGLTEARRIRADLFLPLFDVPYYPTSPSIDKNAKVTFDTMYRSSLIYYVVGRIQLRDDEPSVDARASSMLNKFMTQLLAVNS